MIKNIAFTACIVIIFGFPANSQDIYEADSLFQEKKYTESFDIYQQILEDERQASASMLLKMAYIKEGLGNFSDALYYLNLYYLKTTDRKVLDKMEELAGKKNVIGYDFNDLEFIQTIFYKYYQTIVFSLLSISILCLAGVYYLKIKRQSNPGLPAVGMVLILGLLFYILNFGKNYNRAIVKKSNTYLMTGPSAAAEVIQIINKGNRLKTLGKTDVWTQVELDSKIGYIRSDKLREVKL